MFNFPPQIFRRAMYLLAVITFQFSFITVSKAQMTITDNVAFQDLVDNLSGTGVVVSNVTFSAVPAHVTGNTSVLAGTYTDVPYNYFDNTIWTQNQGIGIDGGIVLATLPVNVVSRNGTNESAYYSGDDVWGQTVNRYPAGQEPDLEALLQERPNAACISLYDVAILEFDFVPQGNQISLNYVFASDEYEGWVCSDYNDVFGFFISGPGINGGYSNNAINIATVPGTNNPVTVNSINHGQESRPEWAGGCTQSDGSDGTNNTQYYRTNNDSWNFTSEHIFGGYTVPLAATANVICGETYHLKIAIADVCDTWLSAAVFFEENSLSSDPLMSDPVGNSHTICEGDNLTLTAPGDGSYTFDWQPTGETTQSITVSPVDSTVYTVTATPPGGCPLIQADTVEVIEPIQVGLVTPICAGNNLTYTISFPIFGGDSETFNLSGTPGTLTGDVVKTFTSDPIPAGSPYNITISDNTGCSTETVSGDWDCEPQCMAFPIVSAGTPDAICEDGTYDLSDATAIDAVEFFQLEDSSLVQWVHDGAGNLSATDITNPTYTPSAADAGNTITLTLIGSSGEVDQTECPNDSAIVTIDVGQLPTVTAGDPVTICASPHTIANVAATNYTTVNWTHDGNGTLDDIDPLNPIYTPGVGDEGTTITLTIIATGIAPCPDATDQVTITIAGGATAEAGNDAVLCSDASHTIVGVTASGYLTLSWTHDGTGTLDDTDPLNPVYTPAPTDGGNIVTLTLLSDAQDPCPDATDQVQLTIVAPPTVEAGSNGSICGVGAYAITDATATDYASLIWAHDGAGTLDDPTLLLPSYTPGITDVGNTVTMTLTVTANSPCVDVFDTMTIDLTGGATSDAGDDATLCSDAIHTITGANASGYNTLAWAHDGQGTLDDTDPMNPIYTPAMTDGGSVVTLELTADAQAPCTDSIDQVQLTIIVPPTVSTPTDGTTCQSAPYTITGVTATEYSSLLWTHDGSGTLDDPTALLPTYTPTPADGGNVVTLTLTAYANSSCTDVTDQMTIDVSATTTANAGDDSNVCIGESHSITSVGASGYTTITWTHDGLGTLDQTDPLNPVYTPDPTEARAVVTLILTVDAPAPCVGTSDQVQLTIIPGPTVDAGSDAVICEGETHTINDATVSNYSTILWTTNGLGIIQDAATLTPTYISSLAETGNTVLLTLTAMPNTPCQQPISDEMAIQIETPSIVDAGRAGTICVTGTYTTTGASAQNHGGLLWTHDGSGSLSDPTILNTVYVPSITDAGNTVNLTLTATGNGTCPDVVSTTRLRVVPLPLAAVNDNATICENQTYILSSTTVDQTTISYVEWAHNGAGTLDDINSINPIYTPGTNDIGSVVTLTMTAYPLAPCTESATGTALLRIIANPTVNAGGDSEICSNEAVGYTISDATATNYSTIAWTHNGQGTLLNETTISPTYQPVLADGGNIVQLTLTATPNAPCSGNAIDVIELGVGEVPEFTVTDGEVCPGETITMDILPINQYDTDMVYDWYTDSTGGTPEHVGENYTTPPLTESVTYWVQPSRGCVGSRVQVNLIVHPLPVAEFTADTDEIENVTTDVQFTDLSIDLANGVWNFGDLTIENYTQGVNPLHTYVIETGEVPESFTITLTGESQYGCPASAELIIPVELKWAIYIPKAFTPGRTTGINDDFIPKGFGLVELKMWIFNRWGDNIYYTEEGIPWGGYDHMYQSGNNQLTSPGLVKEDTYVYKVEIINVFGEKHTYIGEVNLIR